MRDKKVTAVEWFEQQLDNLDIEIPFWVFNEAKEMEKQQIIHAYKKGFSDCDDIGIMVYEDYYNEKFQNNNK